MTLSVSPVKTRATPSGALEVDLVITPPSGEASAVGPALSSRAIDDVRTLLSEMLSPTSPGP